MATFTAWWKEEKEEKKKLSQFMSQKWLAQFSYNLKCGVLIVEGISIAKIVQFHWRSMKVYTHKNYAIVFSYQYTHGVVCKAWHTNVCLDAAHMQAVNIHHQGFI